MLLNSLVTTFYKALHTRMIKNKVMQT